MTNRRISEEHSNELLRILLDDPGADDSDVRDAVSSGLRQHHCDDLARHVRWRRRGIYAICRMLEQGRHARPSLDDVKAADGVEQWAKVYWILLNLPGPGSKSVADVGDLPSWHDRGYAPMANTVLDELQGAAKEERDRIAEGLAVRLSRRDRRKVESQLAKLMAVARDSSI